MDKTTKSDKTGDSTAPLDAMDAAAEVARLTKLCKELKRERNSFRRQATCLRLLLRRAYEGPEQPEPAPDDDGELMDLTMETLRWLAALGSHREVAYPVIAEGSHYAGELLKLWKASAKRGDTREPL